jgi:hypothetical protein
MRVSIPLDNRLMAADHILRSIATSRVRSAARYHVTGFRRMQLGREEFSFCIETEQLYKLSVWLFG